MANLGNRFAIAKLYEKYLNEKEILSKLACIFTKNVILLLELSVSACTNQPTSFSACGISAPNELIY